jgi:hypothetical protein
MEQRKHKPELIGDKRTATIVLCCTAFIGALSIRAALSHAPRNPHWLISLDYISLPIWVVALVNLGFYLYFLLVGVKLYRIAQGKERIVVAGWFGVIFLSPLQNLVSMPYAAAIQWVKATGITVALLTAAYIFLKSPAPAAGITKLAKQCLLVLCIVFATALVLGALLYFVPKR